MPIKLKPGTVYFLRERDFRTGDFTDYCKIGLVAGERTTEQRVREHQTGNPREIREEVSVETLAVDDLEAYMHGRFAPWRVSGEWFRLTPERLGEAVDEARARSRTVADAEPLLAEALRLGSEVSTEPVRPAAQEEQAAHAALLELLRETNRIGAELQLLEMQLRAAMGTARGLDGIVEVVLAGGGAAFQRTRFAEEHPALHDRFLVEREPRLASSFRLSDKPGKREWPEELAERHAELKASLPTLEPGQLNTEAAARTDGVEELHDAYLRTTRTLRELEFDAAVLEARIQAACGTHQGIEGVCTWKREWKDRSPKFDERAFREAHGELYEQYLVDRDPTVRVGVLRYRAYPVG